MADEEQLVSDESLQAGPSSLPADLPGEAPPSETTPPTKKKLKSYDAKFKLGVITFAEVHGNREASRRFGVGESSVRDWRKQKEKLALVPAKSQRLPGGRRKAHAPDMEEELIAWIDSQRSGHLRVTRSSIQRKALELYHGEGDFSASRGWIEKFLKRNGFSLRRRTTVSQRLPQDLIPKVSSFVLRVRKLRLQHQYALSAIGNMDETPLWLDMPGDTTVARVGQRSVSIRTTGHDKGRFTVILAAKANGRKLKPFEVFKEVRPIAELSKVTGVIVCLSRNGWMNEALTIKWVDSVWGCLSFSRRLLICDAFRYTYRQAL